MIPYTLIAKLAGIGVICFALVMLVLSWMSRGQEIARLTDWQNAVVISTTDATVEPDADGVRKSLLAAQVPAAIAALKRSYDSAHGAISQMTIDTEAAKSRAELADKALATANVLFEQRYQSAEKRIAALDARKPQATPELQCQAIGQDSKAAWEGWR